jgi:hypothetical protein
MFVLLHLQTWIDIPSFRNMVTRFHTTTALREGLQSAQLRDGNPLVYFFFAEVAPKVLFQDVTTRWFSTFIMLDRCVELRSYVATVLRDTGHEEYLPTQADWSAAHFLLQTLRPLKELSDRLEHCHDVTISMVSVSDFNLSGDSQDEGAH